MSMNRLLLLPILLLAVLVRPAAARDPERLTPLLISVQERPIPFPGSDGRTHLVYELWLTNFSSGEILVEKVEVLAGDAVLATFDRTEIATRLQPFGVRESRANMAASTGALLFVHVVVASPERVPRKLTHRVAARMSAAAMPRATRALRSRSTAGFGCRSASPWTGSSSTRRAGSTLAPATTRPATRFSARKSWR
jgi:hypothetical protein